MNSNALFKRLARAIRVVRLCIVLASGAVSSDAQVGDWTPSGLLLDVIRRIESSDGRMLVGDQGRSLGAYQLSKGAWTDVNAWRKNRGLETCEYGTRVWNEADSRAYAANYLTILHSRLTKALKREPTAGELYAAYNMGFACFARCGYAMENVNAMTVRKCRQIDAVIASGELTPAAIKEGMSASRQSTDRPRPRV